MQSTYKVEKIEQPGRALWTFRDTLTGERHPHHFLTKREAKAMCDAYNGVEVA